MTTKRTTDPLFIELDRQLAQQKANPGGPRANFTQFQLAIAERATRINISLAVMNARIGVDTQLLRHIMEEEFGLTPLDAAIARTGTHHDEDE